MRKHYVIFLSPGTFFSETTIKPIDSWDIKKAVEMSKNISERYYAKPYGFYFITNLEGGDVPDGEGGFLKVEPKQVNKSGVYHLGSKLLTMEDVEERKSSEDSILYSNMKNNYWFVVAENKNSFSHIAKFEPEDVLLDLEGNIIDNGNSEHWTAYRIQWKEKVDDYYRNLGINV